MLQSKAHIYLSPLEEWAFFTTHVFQWQVGLDHVVGKWLKTAILWSKNTGICRYKRLQELTKACFKLRATDVLSWLEFSTTVAP